MPPLSIEWKGRRGGWWGVKKDHRAAWCTEQRIGHEMERRNQFQRSGYRLMAIRGCTSGWLRRRISVRWNLRGRPREMGNVVLGILVDTAGLLFSVSIVIKFRRRNAEPRGGCGRTGREGFITRKTLRWERNGATWIAPRPGVNTGATDYSNLLNTRGECETKAALPSALFLSFL